MNENEKADKIKLLKQVGLWVESDLKAAEIPPEILGGISPEFATQYEVLPISVDDEKITLVTGLDILEETSQATEEMAIELGKSIQLHAADTMNVREAIAHHYQIHESEIGASKDENIFLLGEEENPSDSPVDEEEKSKVEQMIEAFMLKATECGATDIHILPTATRSDPARIDNVLFRVDGALQNESNSFQIAPSSHPNIVSFLKNNCKPELKIEVTKTPQNGSFSIKTKKGYIDIRASFHPTVRGEKIVLRLLNTNNVPLNLESLGFEPEDLIKLESSLVKPDGLIIYTGPTGQGKSTSMYAALTKFSGTEYNVCTVEDPVEYTVADFAQSTIKPAEVDAMDFTWDKANKSLLRQDPDIWVLGELRDGTTVTAAVRASQSGHRVFCTFHAKNASIAITRMLSMGNIERSQLLDEMKVIVSQRLVMHQCPHCLKPHVPADKYLNALSAEERTRIGSALYKSAGCEKCGGKGTSKRSLIAEFLFVDDDIRDFFDSQKTRAETKVFLEEKGFRSMWERGLDLVAKNVITLESLVSAIPENK